jgi:hypothetical protein
MDRGLYVSSDTGKSWIHYNSNDGWSVTSFANLDSTLFVGVEGVFASSDSTKSWTRRSSGLQDTTINHYDLYVESLYSFGHYLFAGTLIYGLFYSSDGGKNWQAENAGLNYGLTIWGTGIIGDYLLIAADNGIWRRPLAEIVTSIQTYQTSTPKQFLLAQNYPNPFNPTTVISYQLPVSTLVTLKVYDELGRLVRTMVNERETSGAHSVTFDAGNLSSGVYFYRLTAGSFVETKKLMLIK